ncbi:MAG: TM0106 family RecB-like putative nuclease [Actinomycetota bacterium]|nr:MAG: TM0106 family RecB-like putative nuclease [Actinomycetota bacterium]
MRSDLKLGTIISTTDLLKFLSCEELSVLDLLRSKGLATPIPVVASEQLAAKMGLLSEAVALDALQEKYGEAVKISARDQKAHAATLAAMNQGAKLIYQGLILTEMGGFLYESRPDFLLKVNYPSSFGDYSYEPIDSKLSKSTNLEDLFQVLDYADALSSVQGTLPRRVHLYLAGREQVSYRSQAYIEEIRLQKDRFIRFVEASKTVYPVGDVFAELDPKPNSRCVVCDWSASCESYWERSDSLYRVANITKQQVMKLIEAGIGSLTELANAKPEDIGHGMPAGVMEMLIAQAKAQLKTIEGGTGKPYFEIRPDAYAQALSGKGLGLLPKPSEGDIFFDIEGDPFYKPDGLEYLFGIAYLNDGALEFKAFWGTDPEMERKAFGDLIDFIIERWENYPDLHVYHYAPYERSAISKLASRCNYKIFEVDSILRGGLLVDLYPAVKGTLILGTDSYSLKKVEKLYLDEGRHESVTTAMGSVETFEAWLGSGEQELLDEIERYNEMDVRSTAMLRDFLMGKRHELVSQTSEFPYRSDGEEVMNDREKNEREAELERLELALVAKAQTAESPEWQRTYQLCSDLISFHVREDKPIWWRYFNLISPERDVSDYMSEPGCIGGLARKSQRQDEKGNACVTYSFDPHQSFKFTDEKLLDPELEYESYLDPGSRSGKISVGAPTHVDYARGLIEIKRNPKYPSERDPQNLVAFNYVSTEVIDKAIQRFASRLINTENPAELRDVGVEVLARDKPKFSFNGQSYLGVAPLVKALGPMETDDVITETAIKVCERLDHSYLVIQGPPGAGKTFLSAKMISDLVKKGNKVFITALSHSAIDNLIEAMVPMVSANEILLRVDGAKAKKMAGVKYIKSAEVASYLQTEGGMAVGATIWNGARQELSKGFDFAFVDEAGQFSLANAIALSTSCRNLVLTGDPQQLAQPVTGSHPFGAACSVLEHLVGGRDVVDDDYGLFLPRTFRMHPRLTNVVSAISYDSKLSSTNDLEKLELLDASPLPRHGLAYIPVEHQGNIYRSQEEVEAAKQVAEFLLQRSWIDKHGKRLEITPDQIMVVAPYNAQTNALRAALDGLASVGTVDKFQGREAPFVIVSLSASDGESSSRGVDFLFSTNRLNVAISRAKVMSIVLASPTLLETKPRTIDQLELLGAVAKVIKASAKVELSKLS